jgi:hypothetical protein
MVTQRRIPFPEVIMVVARTYGTRFLVVAVILMTLIALPWLLVNFIMFLWEQEPWGAVDLQYRYKEVQYWFAGKPVYSRWRHAVYPPASYTLLWPLLGWLTFTPVKVVWAATMAIALGWLVYFLVKESRAHTTLERVFVVLMLLSMYATGFAIGHGQLTIHTLAALVAGLTVVSRAHRTWHDDLIGAALIIVALVKPTVSVPFLWLVLLIPETFRPALLVVVGYVLLTLLAISFQGFDLFTIHHDWGARSVEGAAWGATTGGYGDLHSWLGSLGLKRWNIPASLLLLLALGYWMYQYRNEDVWLLIGITALVARTWVYHRAYDDMLILLPMVTLFRMAKQETTKNKEDVLAGGLLAVVILAMFAPAFQLVFPTWEPLLKALQTLVRILLLLFFFSR